jgi:glycosyltransferase involved in cell wall biosynthesis
VIEGALDIGVYGARGIPSTYSGYETFLTVLLPELARRGHQVTMYCRKEFVDDETPFRGVSRRVLPSVRSKSLDTLSHGALSAAAARLRGHDVVLVVNVANAAFCGLGRWTGQPVVLNTDGQEWLRGKWGAIGRRVFHLSATLARHSATALIADCAAMADIYANEFHAPSTVIPYCWTDLPDSDDVAVLERLGVAPGQYACIAGRLVPENNAVEVAEAYIASRMRWPLLVLGAANYDSPVARSLESLAEQDERIRVVGHVSSRGEFATMLRQAGVYLHAHSVGGINPSLVEAMGLGALVYALDTPFNREAVGSAGRIFATCGTDLVQLLDELAEGGAGDTQGSRAAAAERVRTVYAMRPVVDAYEDLLRAAAAADARGTVTLDTPWAARFQRDVLRTAGV